MEFSKLKNNIEDKKWTPATRHKNSNGKCLAFFVLTLVYVNINL